MLLKQLLGSPSPPAHVLFPGGGENLSGEARPACQKTRSESLQHGDALKEWSWSTAHPGLRGLAACSPGRLSWSTLSSQPPVLTTKLHATALPGPLDSEPCTAHSTSTAAVHLHTAHLCHARRVQVPLSCTDPLSPWVDRPQLCSESCQYPRGSRSILCCQDNLVD